MSSSCRLTARPPARAIALAGLIVLLAPTASFGQAGAAAPPSQAESADLAKKLANPVADLVSVPFQFNWEQPAGPDKDTRFILNVQPVMPFSLNPHVNMITRLIMPLVSQPALVEGGAPTFGVSDILFSNFFSPVNSSSVTWGVGPILSLPSTSEPTLGSGKWSAGPTFVVLRQSGPLTYGLLFNQLWSFAGNTTRADVNQTFLQPFFAYTTKGAVTVTISSESTGNWEASDQRWNVPIIFAVSKLSSFGVFPASYQIGLGVFAVHPDNSPSWKLRGAIVILLPRKK